MKTTSTTKRRPIPERKYFNSAIARQLDGKRELVTLRYPRIDGPPETVLELDPSKSYLILYDPSRIDVDALVNIKLSTAVDGVFVPVIPGGHNDHDAAPALRHRQ